MRVVCSLSVGVFSYGLHVCGGFWFVVFRAEVSSVVSTHSTGVCFYHHVKVVYGLGQGQRVLAGGASGWTVVGGFWLHTVRENAFVPS